MSHSADEPKNIHNQVKNILRDIQSDFFTRLITVSDFEQRLKEEEQATDGLRILIEKVQKLADQAAIENSHLKVENDCLRRQINTIKARQEGQPTETALDFEPVKSQKQSKFWAGIKRIIGE